MGFVHDFCGRYSFSQLYFITDIDDNLLIHSAIGGCSSYFQFGANKNSAAMNVDTQIFG